MQIPPIPQLSHLIRHFLILESSGPAKTLHRLIPDGNPGIVFQNGLHPLPKSFFYGQITRPHNIVSNGNIDALIVVLYPEALTILTGIAANTFTDTSISLQKIWGKKAADLERQLGPPTTGPKEKIEHIETFLLHQHQPPTNSLIRQSLDWLEHHETRNIETMAAELDTSKRTLERVFKTNIGIPPKQWAGIIRTQQFLKALQKTETENITQLAYEFGYYDQSHLIRDFKTKTGITPLKYFAATNALALNFIQFPA